MAGSQVANLDEVMGKFVAMDKLIRMVQVDSKATRPYPGVETSRRRVDEQSMEECQLFDSIRGMRLEMENNWKAARQWQSGKHLFQCHCGYQKMHL